MTRRERLTFEAVVAAAAAPGEGLPAVVDTDVVEAFARYLDMCPAAGRIGLRGLLGFVEVAPLVVPGSGARRFSRLGPERGAAFLERASRGPLEGPLKALAGLAQLFYYGDAGVAAAVGYDAESRVARGRALRAAEGRW